MSAPPSSRGDLRTGHHAEQRVTNDLLDCPADGLVIGANGITLDLDDHTIDGTNLGFGVLNNGFDSVTIANGTVQEFDAGVQLGNGTALSIVDDMTVQLQEFAGIQLTNADDGANGNIIRNNTVVTSGGGIWLLTGTQRAIMRGNTIAGVAGIGLHLFQVSSNFVEGNEISGVADASVLLEGASDNTVIGNAVSGSGDSSVIVQLGSNGNRIEGNDLLDGEAGISILQSSENELLANVIHGMGDTGIILEDAHDNLVDGNDVRFNSGGIEMDGATGNRVEANNASETDGVGIEVGDASVGNEFVLNVANFNEAGGIAIETFAAPGSGNLLDRNAAHSNTGDGIYVGDVGHMIAGNSANNNSEWGIYAADPVVAGQNIDGGGNTASGNTGGEVDPITLLPLQCKNIVCDGGPPLASDVVPPTTAISSAPLSGTLQTTATFRFTGMDNASSVTFECRLDSTVRSRLRALRQPAGVHEPRRGRAHLRGARHRLHRQRRSDTSRAHLDDQRPRSGRPAGNDHRRRSRHHHGQHVGIVHVLVERAERHVRVLPRRRGLRPMHIPPGVLRPLRRRSPLRGARRGQLSCSSTRHQRCTSGTSRQPRRPAASAAGN